MNRILIAVALLALVCLGVENGGIVEDGTRWPVVRSYCSPDQPGVRVYESSFVKDGYGGGGASVAVIADTACGGNG